MIGKRGLYESAALYQEGVSQMQGAMKEQDVTKQYEEQIQQYTQQEVLSEPSECT